MGELNLAGQQRLRRRGAAAHVNQVRVKAMFFKNPLLVGDPEGADPRRQGAIGGTDKGRPGLRRQMRRARNHTKSQERDPEAAPSTQFHGTHPINYLPRRKEETRQEKNRVRSYFY